MDDNYDTAPVNISETSMAHASLLEKLLPRRADNDYRGHPIALYAFWVLMIPFTFRALVHFLKDDSGVNSIASILVFPGSPDPNTVIHMFSSAWGGQQLIMLFVYTTVLLRYRSLLPLMYVTLVLENLFRMVTGSLHPLTEAHFEHTPPGAFATLPLLIVAIVMGILSLRTHREAAAAAGAHPETA